MDPVIFDVVGPVKLRWYGLAYLLSFVAGFYLLRWLSRNKLWVLPEDKVADFVAYAAFFGVFLGGRLGYILFYQIPKTGGWTELMNDPAMVLRVWDGGMASHGGIIGLMIFTYIYARKNKVSWLGLGDGLCVVAPIGLGLVRLANYINGELYGRVAVGVDWGVKFPSSLADDYWKSDPSKYQEALRACVEVDPSISGQSYEFLIARSRENPELLGVLGEFLKIRHPSQLYEAFLEGVVLFSILFFIRIKFPRLAYGVLTGLFFILYAVFRIIVELYREPDSAMVGVLTKGQFYSVFMIALGFAFIGVAFWRQSKSLVK